MNTRERKEDKEPMLVNQIVVAGNLGRDPDMSYTTQGTALTKFSIAVWQGEKQPTLWLNVICWNNLAEKVNEKLRKGQEVLVQGRLSIRPYEDKNGVSRQAVEVVASSVQQTQKKDRTESTSDTNSGPLDDLSDLDDRPF